MFELQKTLKFTYLTKNEEMRWWKLISFQSSSVYCYVLYYELLCIKLILLLMAHNTKCPASCILALSSLLCCFHLGV